MSLNKGQLKSAIKQVLVNVDNYNRQAGATVEEARELFATQLSDAIDAFVKTGQITIEVSDVQVQVGSSSGVNTNQVTKNVQ